MNHKVNMEYKVENSTRQYVDLVESLARCVNIPVKFQDMSTDEIIRKAKGQYWMIRMKS